MKITSLYIKGYGCFTDREFHFGEGLNLIYGPNETGKSTLLSFILAMLYGHKKPGLKRASYLEEQESMLPWQGEAFGGTLEYVVRGVGYRVQRDLHKDRERVELFEAVTGRELSGDFPQDSRRERLFAEAHLGLNRDLFLRTTCVRQSQAGVANKQMGGAEDGAGTSELAARLLNLQSTGDEEVSVQQALNCLQTRLEEIGSQKAPSKPYARTVLKVTEFTRRLTELKLKRDKLLQNESALSLTKTAIRELDSGSTDPLKCLKKLGPEVLAGQWQRVWEFAQRWAKISIEIKGVQAFREFPGEYRDELLQLTARAEELDNEIPKTDEFKQQPKANAITNAKAKSIGYSPILLASVLVCCVGGALLAILYTPWFWIGVAGFGVVAVVTALWALGGSLLQNNRSKELDRIEQQIRLTQLNKRVGELLQVAGVPDLEAYLSGCRKRYAWEELNRETKQINEYLQSILVAVQSGWAERVKELNQISQELAEVEGELDKANAELATLSQERAALELAAGCIREASEEVHRDFAPRLNARIGRLINDITQGRYNQVRVDGSLNLRVLTPETGSLVPLSSLSSGTVDQFNLALRIAVADLLTGGQGGLPLILDDCFGQWDDERLSGILAYLLEMAQDNQILLFSCQQREGNILAALNPREQGYKVLNLGHNI
ncbi:MAG: AAA family ATPase [Carboxydocellales bacterium]